MTQPTDLQLVEKYLELKTKVAAATEAYKELIQPDEEAMELIEGEFLRRFMERGSDNSKTQAGTAYKSTIVNFEVVDRDAFLNFCLEYWDKGGADMVSIKTVKDGVKEHLNGSQNLPPGLSQSQITRVNVRRT